jgi:hypothetical protein
MTAETAAVLTASTKRQPELADGRILAPITHLESILVVPGLPVQPETINTVTLQSPREAKETFAFAGADGSLPDVVEGDLLVIGGVEYVIRAVAEWPRPAGGSFIHIVYEEQKAS